MNSSLLENLLILILLVVLQMERIASQGVPYTAGIKLQPKTFAVKDIKRPSLATAFKILQPEKIASLHGPKQTPQKHVLTPLHPSKFVDKLKFKNTRGNGQLNQGTYLSKVNGLVRSARTGPLIKKVSSVTKTPAVELLKKQQQRRLAAQRQAIKANSGLKGKQLPAEKSMKYSSAKRQKLWYPGDLNINQVRKLSLPGGLQTAFPVNEKPVYVTNMQTGPGRSLTTQLILSKLHSNHFRPHEMINQVISKPANRISPPIKQLSGIDSNGYVGTMSMLLHHDDVNEDFHIGGTTLKSPYAAVSYKPEDYFGPITPHRAVEEPGYARSIGLKNQPAAANFYAAAHSNAAASYDATAHYDATPRLKQSTIVNTDKSANDNLSLENKSEQRGSFVPARAARPIVSSSFKSDLATERPDAKRPAISGYDKAGVVNNESEVQSNEADQKWEKMQKEKEERWRQYQNGKEARWKEMAGKKQNSGNAAVRHTDVRVEQGHPTDTQSYATEGGMYKGDLGNQNLKQYNVENQNDYNVQYFATGGNSYDYKTDRQFSGKGLNQTEELLPTGGTVGNIQVSLEKGQSFGGKGDVKINSQSKIVNLEVVDKPKTPVTAPLAKQSSDSDKGTEPTKGGLPEEGGSPEKGGPLDKGTPLEKGGAPENSGPPDKGQMIEKIGPPEKGAETLCEGSDMSEQEKQHCFNKPEKSPEGNPPNREEKAGNEESLLDRMEQKLASILSFMEYSGGLHTIEIVSSGCDDPPANGEDCNKATGTISIDGEQISNNDIGFNIAVLDYPSFKLRKVRTFDTNMDIAKSQKLASFLMSLQETSIILVAVKGDIAGAVGQEVWDTLTLFGARAPFDKKRRSSLAFIGCRGDCQLPWIQQVQRSAGQGPSAIHIIIGANKEYVSFGGGGPAVNDALKTGENSTSMSEGNNAGLPSKFVPSQISPEQMSQSVPHSAHELVSNQEIIKDVDGMRAQKEATGYLNRQEAGELGLGREVPMQKANLLSPYGRELRYQYSNAANEEVPIGKGNLEGHMGLGGKRKNNVDGKISADDHQEIDRIPTEAESDNEPFPEDAMSIPNQLKPIEIASIEKQQLVQQSAGEQEANRISRVNDMRPGVVSRYGHANKSTNDEKEASFGRAEPVQDSKSREMFQSHDISYSHEPKLQAYPISQQPNEATRQESMNYDKSKGGATVQPLADNVPHDSEARKDLKYDKSSRYQEAERKADEAAIYQGKSEGDVRGAASQRFGSQGNKNLRENEEQQPGTGLYQENSNIIDVQNGKTAKEKMGINEKEVRNEKETTSDKQVAQLLPLSKEGQSDSGETQRGTDKEFLRKGGNPTGHGEEEHKVITENHEHGFTSEQQMTNDNGKGEPCKHCDIYPEVTYSLESSDATAGPLKCTGCGGPRPKLTPVVENLGLNMTVTDKLVSPKYRLVLQGTKMTPIPQTKGEITNYDGQSKDDVHTMKINEHIDDRSGRQQNAAKEYYGSYGNEALQNQMGAQHENEALHNQGSDYSSSQFRSTSRDKANQSGAGALRGNNGPSKQHESYEPIVPSTYGPSRENSISQTQSAPYGQNSVEAQMSLKEQRPSYAPSQETTIIKNTNKVADHPILAKEQNEKALPSDAVSGSDSLPYTGQGGGEPTGPKMENEHGVSSMNNIKDKAKQDAQTPNQKTVQDVHKSIAPIAKESLLRAKPPSDELQSNTSGKTIAPPAAKAESGPKHDLSREANDERKSTNLTTLVEIITKGMKALRESNFDIGGNNNSNKERNEGPTNGKGEGQGTKGMKSNMEHANQKEENDAMPTHKQSGLSSVSLGAPKPENFPAAVQPERVVSQMHGGNHNSIDVHGDVGKTTSDSKALQGRMRPGADGKFSGGSLELPKHAWHERKCAGKPELCKESNSATVQSHGGAPNENNMHFTRPKNSDNFGVECGTFFNLPDRQKRKLPKKKLEKLKRNCMPHHQSDIEPLNVADIKNEDTSRGDKARNNEALLNAGRKSTALDKINLSAAKVKIASLLSQETPEKTAPPGFHPGYTTMAFSHGAAIPEKKQDTMPDTAETFVSKTDRPDFSSLAGETSGKSSDMAYYFNQKKEQKEKDMLMRAMPEANGPITNFNNPYGNVYQMAENLLQKDYALAYKEASTALNRRVENEQKLLNDNKLTVLAKRRLKKPPVKRPVTRPRKKA